MLLLLLDEDHRLIAREARSWERVLARLRAEQLDGDLAAGVAPESTALLAIRAQILVRPRVRRGLVRSLRQVLLEATGPDTHRYGPRIPVRRERVADARPAFESLIRHLLAPGPVSARLVARVKELLTDGYGPLYCAESLEDLRGRAEDAIEASSRPQA